MPVLQGVGGGMVPYSSVSRLVSVVHTPARKIKGRLGSTYLYGRMLRGSTSKTWRRKNVPVTPRPQSLTRTVASVGGTPSTGRRYDQYQSTRSDVFNYLGGPVRESPRVPGRVFTVRTFERGWRPRVRQVDSSSDVRDPGYSSPGVDSGRLDPGIYEVGEWEPFF